MVEDCCVLHITLEPMAGTQDLAGSAATTRQQMEWRTALSDFVYCGRIACAEGQASTWPACGGDNAAAQRVEGGVQD